MRINSTIFFTIISIFYSTLLIIAYFFKEKIKTPENRVYSKLIIINFFEIVLELICCIFAGVAINSIGLYTIINKLFLSSLILWGCVFGVYTFLISTDITEKNELKLYMKKVVSYYSLFFVILVSLIIKFPVEFNIKDGYVMFSYGPAVNIVYFGIFVSIILIISCLIKNYKNLKFLH